MRTTVHLVTTLVIHPSVPVPTHCAVCAHWDIDAPAAFFGQWEDVCGPDSYMGVCDNCRMSGFKYIGTIEEFKECQSRATKHEYEVYGNDSARTHYDCANRADACARIRKMIAHGISIGAVYQRVGGHLVKLYQDDQARIVIEAMNS